MSFSWICTSSLFFSISVLSGNLYWCTLFFACFHLFLYLYLHFVFQAFCISALVYSAQFARCLHTESHPGQRLFRHGAKCITRHPFTRLCVPLDLSVYTSVFTTLSLFRCNAKCITRHLTTHWTSLHTSVYTTYSLFRRDAKCITRPLCIFLSAHQF